MEKHTAVQEILLLTASSFAQKDLVDGDSFEDSGKRPGPVEKLEEACWNGLLDDFFRNTPSNSRNGNKLFLWKIHVADAFLCVELAQSPSAPDRFHSLDPYLFLPLKHHN